MRSPREIVHKKLLKRIGFPLLNRFLGETGQHLYHYSVEHDRLYPLTRFNSANYDYLRTGSIDTDRWRGCLSSLEKGGTILDIGGNVGFTAVWFAAVADRVYAFEPHPANLELLRDQLRIRRVTNVDVRPMAVGDRTEPVELYCKDPRGQHALADIGGSPTLGSIRVPCTTVDAVLESEGIDDLRLLKIDVEGFEPEVLRGARRALEEGAVPRILFEFSPQLYRERGIEASAPVDHLLGLGYRLSFPDWTPFDPKDPRASIQCDVIALAPGALWGNAPTV